jgi:hypothetical protein
MSLVPTCLRPPSSAPPVGRTAAAAPAQRTPEQTAALCAAWAESHETPELGGPVDLALQAHGLSRSRITEFFRRQRNRAGEARQTAGGEAAAPPAVAPDRWSAVTLTQVAVLAKVRHGNGKVGDVNGGLENSAASLAAPQLAMLKCLEGCGSGQEALGAVTAALLAQLHVLHNCAAAAAAKSKSGRRRAKAGKHSSRSAASWVYSAALGQNV